jgi:large subunit ribosomal protein L10
MAVTRAQKEDQVKDLTERMKNASSVIFAHYIGLSVTNISKLRTNLRKEQAEMKVAKKSLIRLAAKAAQLPEVSDEMMPGPVACIFSNGEPTAGASAAFKFGKDNPQVVLIGGIFDGKLLTAAQAKEMATIPSKLQLIGIFMSMCNSPLTSFASAVSSPLSGFARSLSELAKKKASESPAPAPIAETPAAPVAAEAPAAPAA